MQNELLFETTNPNVLPAEPQNRRSIVIYHTGERLSAVVKNSADLYLHKDCSILTSV